MKPWLANLLRLLLVAAVLLLGWFGFANAAPEWTVDDTGPGIATFTASPRAGRPATRSRGRHA